MSKFTRAASCAAPNSAAAPSHTARTPVFERARSFESPTVLQPVAPLQRFSVAKEEICALLADLSSVLARAAAFTAEPPRWVARASGSTAGVVQTADVTSARALVDAAQRKIVGIADIVARNHMKVVFIGHTSNGKSLVINALLGQDILPSSFGHTTNCFCVVTGTPAADAFLTSSVSDVVHSIVEVKSLAHALNANVVAADSVLTVHWPRQSCTLLQADVELMDSPGLDSSELLDTWIDTYCSDADVFVLVANGESTINVTERRFFERVKAKLSSPNIFVLFNRWDNVAQGLAKPAELELVRQQHLVNAQSLLAGSDNALTVDRRVFFVSALEALWRRAHPAKAEARAVADPTLHARYMEFERFERLFEECISQSAIRTRFKAHADESIASATAVSLEFGTLAGALERHVIEVAQRQAELQQHVDRLCERSETVLAALESDVAAAVALILPDVVQEMRTNALDVLSTAVADFRHPRFQAADYSEYHALLADNVQHHLDEDVAAHVARMLNQRFAQLQMTIQSHLDDLLPPAFVPRLQLASAQRNIAAFRFSLDAASFRPDLRFRFSFSLNRITNALMANPYSQDLATKCLPATYLSLQPLVVTLKEESPIMLGAIFSLSSAVQSSGAVLAFGGVTFILFRHTAVKMTGWFLVIFSGLYAFEYAGYTSAAMERKFKHLFVQHMTLEIDGFARHTCPGKVADVGSELAVQLDRAKACVHEFRVQMEADLASAQREGAALSAAVQRAREIQAAAKASLLGLQHFLSCYITA